MESESDVAAYEFGPFLLLPRAYRLTRLGEPVPLGVKEFEILLFLVRNRGRIVEKKEIMAAVWPDTEVEENNLTVRMSSLRRALGETKGYHPYIQTAPGRGYWLISPVKGLTEEPVSGAPDTGAMARSAPVAPASSDADGEAADAQPIRREQAYDGARPSDLPAAPGRRTRWLRGFGLYALLFGLLVAVLLYWGLWRKRGEEPGPSTQSMKMSRLTQTGRVVGAAISPDGQNIAYVERDGPLHSLWLQRAGTNNPLRLLPPAELVYRDPAFSRDGNMLYYSKCQPNCQLNRMPVMGGVETALPVRADSPVTFSPDGRRMAYVRVAAVGVGTDVSLLVANADGTGEEALNSRIGGIAYQRGAPAWSPDGKVIAFPLLETEGEKAHMKVVGVNVADRAETTLTGQRWRFIKDVAWLPGGDGFIINARDETSAPELAMQVWRVSYPGGEARRITNDLNNYTRLGLSADGRTLLALEEQWTAGLWMAPAESPSGATQVTRGAIDRKDGNLGLSLAPDGRLVFVSHVSGKRDLWAVNADGTGLTQLTDGPHKDIYPAVTPDGRYVVFESTREGAHGIWRVDADGRNPTRLTRGSYDSEPACSPDGKWVVYVSDEGGIPKLRKVPIEGGDPVRLTENYSMRPTISPDGKEIAYYRMDMEKRERREIVIIPAQGGAAVRTLSAPKNFGSVMRWAPAGDALTYIDNTHTGLWRLPLDGSQPGPVAALRGERLFTFCYSHDGRRLAYASGPSLSDVILITQLD